jgi:hypothetical protein
LPKKKLANIMLQASGKIETKDGTHPPALKEVLLESDKNGTIDTKGVAVCKSGQLQSRDTKGAEKACGKSIIGTGTTEVEIAFPEQSPIPVKSKLLVFNGGTAGGKTTLFIHAYITVPTPAAIMTTVKIKKIHKGRYGLLSVASIPKEANGFPREPHQRLEETPKISACLTGRARLLSAIWTILNITCSTPRAASRRLPNLLSVTRTVLLWPAANVTTFFPTVGPRPRVSRRFALRATSWGPVSLFLTLMEKVTVQLAPLGPVHLIGIVAVMPCAPR